MVFTRHPVDSHISQPWGANKTGGIIPDPNGDAMQQLVYNYGNYQPFGHDGIDYGCPIGTPVYAPGYGTIEYSGWGQDMPKHVADKYGFAYGPAGAASGIIVCIQMDGAPIGCYVAHLDESYYGAGHRVGPSTVVGLSGNSGRSGGPHCHFSAIRFPVDYLDGLYSRVNPLSLFTTVTHVQILPGASTGDPATGTADPMEEIMSMFKDKADYSKWMQDQVLWAHKNSAELSAWFQKQVVNALLNTPKVAELVAEMAAQKLLDTEVQRYTVVDGKSVPEGKRTTTLRHELGNRNQIDSRILNISVPPVPSVPPKEQA